MLILLTIQVIELHKNRILKQFNYVRIYMVIHLIVHSLLQSFNFKNFVFI